MNLQQANTYIELLEHWSDSGKRGLKKKIKAVKREVELLKTEAIPIKTIKKEKPVIMNYDYMNKLLQEITKDRIKNDRSKFDNWIIDDE